MEAELKFEREEINGVAVVGTYLIDSARRLGIEIVDECGRLGLCDTCAVTIKSGAEFLTPPTKAEIELLSNERRANGERLSCQAKIASEGEIVVVTRKKAEDETPKDPNEEYRKEFAEMPLEKKIANLVQLEAMTLGETFSFIMNSPYKIIGKVMDVMAEFGLKIEDETKKATRPAEHKTETNGHKADGSTESERNNETETSTDSDDSVPAEESVSAAAYKADDEKKDDEKKGNEKKDNES